MITILVCNIILILCLTALAWFFGPTNNRSFAAFWVGMLALNLSFWGWVIFAAVHFITLYW